MNHPRSLRSFRNALVLAVVASLALVALGCDDAVTTGNPNAHFGREALLVSVGTTSDVTVLDVADLGALRVRRDGDAARGSLRRVGDFLTYSALEVTAERLGTTTFELLDGDTVLDTVTVEVTTFGHLELVPAQNAFEDVFPAVPLPFALVTNHRVLLSLVARDASGRLLDDAAQAQGSLRTDDADVTLDGSDELPRIRIATAGTHTLTVDSDAGELDVSLEVVAPDAVESLSIAARDMGDGQMSFSVTGVTASGVHVVGLSPQLTIDGEGITSSLGDWLFESTGPVTPGTVEASLDGLTATW